MATSLIGEYSCNTKKLAQRNVIKMYILSKSINFLKPADNVHCGFFDRLQEKLQNRKPQAVCYVQNWLF